MKRKYRHIMGKNTIREMLKASPDRLVAVYTCQDNDPLVKELKDAGIHVNSVSKRELTERVDSESHQSFVASVKERSRMTLDEFLESSPDRSLVLMLDSIYDPQNLGAILRAGECFGVDLVIYSKNRGTDITPTVAKVSSGASELLNIIKVSNLADNIKAFQDAGYWVICTDVGEGAQSLHGFEFPEKTVLILGSEGEGVRHLLKKKADFRIYIPMKGNIDSLNVSQATAVLLSAYSSQIS